MVVRVLNSNEAQQNWQEILDASGENHDTIIQRADKPVAAIIPYDDYIALLDTLNALRQKRFSTQADERSGSADDSLLSLAGRFASGIEDTAERAEEILEAEVSSVTGLSTE